MKGGVVPGGMERTADCEIAVTWATASEILTAGRKKILITEMPERVGLDVLDVVDRHGQATFVRGDDRFPISAADIPA